MKRNWKNYLESFLQLKEPNFTINSLVFSIIVKQNELDGDLEFTMTIGLGGKSTIYKKSNKIQNWKWKGVCKAYRNSISKFNVG